MKTETAVFGGGCFWCTEAIFKRLKGVISVMPGYAGGHVDHPTYQGVCSGTTGHAEVIQIEFDPDVISYGDLLEVFWQAHDPTSLNRQGNDIGTQYRSIILTTSEVQREKAQAAIKEINESGQYGMPLVTQVKPLEAFYEAEQYHQDYYANNQNQPYCRMIISPKISHFVKEFPDKLA
jgi:peptide-methionine (S)-S-oxide reductase